MIPSVVAWRAACAIVGRSVGSDMIAPLCAEGWCPRASPMPWPWGGLPTAGDVGTDRRWSLPVGRLVSGNGWVVGRVVVPQGQSYALALGRASPDHRQPWHGPPVVL